MTIALKYCKAAPAIAMSYLSIVWGLLGGYFFFHEVSHCLGRQVTTFRVVIEPPPSARTCSSSHELLCMPSLSFASCCSAAVTARLWSSCKQGNSPAYFEGKGMLRAGTTPSLTCGPRLCRCPTACHWRVQASSAAARFCWAWWSSGSPLPALMAPQRNLLFPEGRLQRLARRLQCLTRRLLSLQWLVASQSPRATFGGLCWTSRRLCWSVAAACCRMCNKAHTGSVWAPHGKHLDSLAALYFPFLELNLCAH